MQNQAPVHIHRLSRDDVAMMRDVLLLFGRVFDDPDCYCERQPSNAYLEERLADPTFIALAALEHDRPVGAIAAYELRKFEQERSEIYIYDLGVLDSHRRRGIATALIRAVRDIAATCSAWVVFVQADHGDEPAINLYTKLGQREDVLHFDIPVDKPD